MGVPINMLPTTTTVTGGDQIVLWLPNQGSAYKASLTTVLGFFETNFANPDFTVVQVAVGTSTAVDLSSRTSNVWLIANPSASASTINLTLPSTSFDGQTIIITCSVPFIVNFTGSGAPANFLGAVDGSVVVRYSSSASAWKPISASGRGLVTPIIIDSINDEFGNEVIRLGRVPSSVNHVEIVNAATGDPVQVNANGGDTDIGLTLRSQGAGQVLIQSPSGNVAVNSPTANVNITATGNVNLTSAGVLSDAQVTATVLRHTSETTVAALPSAATAGRGTRRFVTDAVAVQPVGTSLTGGGALFMPVYSDGTIWRYG